MQPKRRRICFVTGTRAEFGLMQRTLRAIAAHPHLQLQMIATGMHLDRSRGRSIGQIFEDGFAVDAIVPWRGSQAVATGQAMSGIARQLDRLKSEIILVVGDRVEAFAAASAAHLSGRPVAHVHGGDRAQGQVDDALRHAITKLAHVHFAATADSAARLIKLGEDPWRVRMVGAPGIDGIRSDATAVFFQGRTPKSFVLLVLHPTQADDALEHRRAETMLQAVLHAQPLPVVIVYPNNDPGSAGIVDCWKQSSRFERVSCIRNLSRPDFLAAMRDAAVIVGNSSAGIIEAESFGTFVVDAGNRQAGRLVSKNVLHCSFVRSSIANAMRRQIIRSKIRRSFITNVYGGQGTAQKIARILNSVPLNQRLISKLIIY